MMIGYLAYRSLTFICARLPFSFQYGVARVLSGVAHAVAGRSRAGVRANLRTVLGPGVDEREICRLTRRTFRSFGRYLCEFFGAAGCDQAFFDKNVRVVGRENLDAALAKGRGLLFVSGHYSNWELGAFVVGRLGYRILIVAQIHADPRVNDLFVRARAVHGVEVAPTANGARAALRALRDNRPVAILGDRPTGGPTVSVTLCGKETCFPQGPWRLALDTGAPLLPTFMRRETNGSYTLLIGSPLDVPERGTREERMAALAKAFGDVLEARLREDPTQWAAFHPVWTCEQCEGPVSVDAPCGCARTAEVHS
jgi:KDO2-lipid IV(A) lauroyltransferase